jgi:predicted ATPase/DNA-binding SARP family transcriptional activator
MEFLILGPLEVLGDSGPIAVPAAKRRAVLAILLLASGSTVPGWRLIEELWPEPPVSARKVVQTYISKLRQILPDGLLVTRQTGYALQVPADDVDARKFERLLAEAGDAHPRDEAALLRDALALWRGPALQDFVDEPFAQADITRLEAMRLSAYERRLELDLAEGRHDAVLAELLSLVQANPLNERLRGQLMLALYRCDRQSDALRVYREGRAVLVDQLGVEPTPSLRRLEEAILRHDPGLHSLAAEAVPGSPPQTRPPPGVGSAARHGPRSAGAFVGRSTELAQLRGLLREDGVRWVTLTGPAGAGKTRLAVELAARVGEEYDEGWAFVDLSRVGDPALIAAEICATIGVLVEDPGAAEAALAEVLGVRRQLLVLDNFEHVREGTTLVASLLDRAPGIAVVITSRASLRGRGEHEFGVATLEVPAPDAPFETLVAADAVALFENRARVVRPDFTLSGSTAPQVAELCAHLDGLPLAIELAAARVDLLSPRALLARMDRRLDLLATDSELLPPRQRSLEAAVDWSYRLLDDRARAALCDLATFQGGFTIDTAEHVVQAKGLVEAVTTLRTANLLHAVGAAGDEPRVAMLETIREFGLARLTASGRRAQVFGAHARAFAGLAAEAEAQLRGPDQMRWLDLIQAELPNIRQAVDWSADGGAPEDAIQTVGSLWRFWQERALTHEARSRLEALLTRPDLTEAARATGDLGIARCAFHQGDFAAVRDHVRACLPHFRRTHDDFSVGFGLLLLGAASGRTGDADAGAAQLREALELAASCRDDWLEACGLGYLGMVLSAQGRHRPARSALEEGLRGCREIGDIRLVGWFLIGLGRTALAADDAASARRRFEEALDWDRRLGDAWSEAWALHGAASAALAERDLPTATDLAVQCLRPAHRSHNRTATAAALRTLATIADRMTDRSVAAEQLGAASVVSDEARRLWRPDGDGVVDVDPASLAAALGRRAFDEHWARGRAMTTAETTALATSVLACSPSGDGA